MDVLHDMGLRPDVDVVEIPSTSRFDSLAEAVKEYREYLLLPDTREARRELRALLARWLVEQGGAWRLPVRTLPSAMCPGRPPTPDLAAETARFSRRFSCQNTPGPRH